MLKNIESNLNEKNTKKYCDILLAYKKIVLNFVTMHCFC